MSITVSIYSNANSTSRTMTFEFVGDVLAAPDAPTSSNVDFYFKVSSGARQDNNTAFPLKVVKSLSDLALNKQKQRIVNTSNAYSNIREMVLDYVYDFVHGHSANLYGSGCTVQYPMKFA